MKNLIEKLVEQIFDELVNSKEPSIYFDMDGVLADFQGRVDQDDFYQQAAREFKKFASKVKPELLDVHVDDLKNVFQGAQQDSVMAKLKKLWNRQRNASYTAAGKPGHFKNLDVLPGAKKMMLAATNLTGKRPHILTAPMESHSTCEEEKREWVEKHLIGLFDNFYCTQDKHNFAKSQWDILIDDRPKYVNKFRSAGGTAIFHTGDADATIQELQETVSKLKGMKEASAIGVGGGSVQSSNQISGTGGNPLGRNMSDQHEIMWSGDDPEDKNIDEEFIGKKGGVSYFQIGSSLPDHLYNRTNDGKPTRDPGVAGLKSQKKKKK